MFKKNISDGVGNQNGSNGTPLDPPLFWLDNIFKGSLQWDNISEKANIGLVVSERHDLFAILNMKFSYFCISYLCFRFVEQIKR